MTVQDFQDKAIDAIMVMNTALTSLRLYPPTSVMISQTIGRLHQAFKEILAEETPLILAESERTLLFGKVPAWPKNQEKPHIRTFVDLLINQGIKSVSFERGLEMEELLAFLQALSRRPDEVRGEGGMQEMLTNQKVRHICIDAKIYLAKNISDQNILDPFIKDEIVRLLTETTDRDAAELKQIKENAKDPEWISGIFQTWMTRLKEKQDTMTKAELSANLVTIARMLEKITEPSDRKRISGLAAASVLEMDNELIGLVLLQDLQSLLGGHFFEEIIEALDEERFAAVSDSLTGMAAGEKESRAAALSLEGLMKTEKGKKLALARQTREAREREERTKCLELLREPIQGLLKGEAAKSLDERLMAELPGIIRELYALEDGHTADTVIERLNERLHDRNHDLRIQAAEALSRSLSDVLAGGQTERTGHLTEKLAGWLRSETVFSPACERICRQLQELERIILTHNPFIEANPLLDAFSSIQSGKHAKDKDMQALIGEVLRDLATEDLIDILLHEFQTNEQGKQKAAIRALGRFGSAPVERLLNILRSSESSDERVRVLQIISEIGAPSVPAIITRLSPDEPWFVLRNLVYVLGRVGSEDQAAVLAPLLLHENQKLQQESLKSLQRIGGKSRADILLFALTKANDQFKISIVEALGTIKALEAVPVLVEMLRSKVIASSWKADMDEKICAALGSIGAEDSLPALMEIVKPKGFFKARAYPEKVKIAAGKAVATITRRKS